MAARSSEQDPASLTDMDHSPLFSFDESQHETHSQPHSEAQQQSPLIDEALPGQSDAVNPQIDYGGITLPTPQAVQRTPSPTPKGRLRIDPVASGRHHAAAAHPTTPSESSGDALKGELLDALLEGMGLRDLQPTPQFDREQMLQFGQMLSMFSQGTVALLSSRSILKRGVKADMTVILDDANNPFKLLPSGKTVLMQMFGSRMPGFMPPRQAVRDALIDLQAHQLGMIAGIRAIIASMLQSFNPEQLEEEARQADRCHVSACRAAVKRRSGSILLSATARRRARSKTISTPCSAKRSCTPMTWKLISTKTHKPTRMTHEYHYCLDVESGRSRQ